MVLLSYEQHGFSGSKVLIGYPLINAMVLVGLPSTYHTGQGRLGGTSPITAKSAEIVIILFMGILLFFVFIWVTAWIRNLSTFLSGYNSYI